MTREPACAQYLTLFNFLALDRRVKRKAMKIYAISTSIRSMGRGSWAILAVLLLLFFGTLFVSYLRWTSAAGIDVPSSGYVALAPGVVFSLIVGVGLMTLLFTAAAGASMNPQGWCGTATVPLTPRV
jgi:hypothetical protein